MTKLVNNIVSISPYIVISEAQQYGGIVFSVNLSQEATLLLDWLQKHTLALEKEEKLRQTVPALANQWERYQTMLKIVMDDV